MFNRTVGREGHCKQITLACARSASATLGLPPQYSNYAWELTNNCDWITTSITSGDASDTGVTVTLTADLTYDDREGTIVFSCGKAKKLLVVSQKLKEVIIPDANNTFNIPAKGGVAVISYQTSVDCEVIIPNYAQSWITIAPASRGLVSESINLDIAENTTYSARIAVVKVVAKDNAELAIEYTINQEQNDAILANGNTEFTISGREQQITIKHKANIDCEVIIPDEAQDWVTIAPSTRGLSTYSTTLNIAENNSGKERNCVVKVTSQGNNEIFAEYTIVQNPRYCLYYTSSNGEIVQPNDSSVFGATIISNTYIDGVGVIEFNAPIPKIGYEAFRGCSSLTSVTIPDSVTTIGKRAFAWCESLASATIPDSVTEIGDAAFNGCRSITDITIPNSIITISEDTFYGCRSLTNVTIPNSVITIDEEAFASCSSLTSVTFGNSVQNVKNKAFTDCTSLTSVHINDLSAWCNISFDYDANPLYYAHNLYINGELMTDLTIPSNITEIKYGAFNKCNCITNVTISDSVTAIGTWAFGYCRNLISAIISDSVTTVGEYAFYYCDSLTDLTIGSSVLKIEKSAFEYCDNLKNIYCKAVTPPTTEEYPFHYVYKQKIYVPMESVEAYKSAQGWSNYASDIVGYNF